MSEEISVHDNILLSYTVDGEQKRIRLSTVYYRDPSPDEYTDVLFEDVLAYHFEGDSLKTIIYDSNSDLFEGLKNYGWPKLPYTSRDDLLARLRSDGYRAFGIASSDGMSGFVFPKQMRVERVTPK